jgi:RNA polymerase sigma factor (sigma-70 family)
MAVTKPILSVLKIKEDTQSVINGIQNGDPKIIEMLYRKDFNRIRQMVRSFNFRHLEPLDIFQEGLTRAVLNVRNGKFNGTSTFSTYLYGICRFICLKESNQPIKVVSLIDDPNSQSYDKEDFDFELIQRISALRLKLEPPCREIIDLRFTPSADGKKGNRLIDYDSIAKILGIQADLARQRLKRCLDRLRSLAKNDPQIIELWDNA